MGKNGYDPRAEESAARVHELSRQPIASPAECAEEGEAAELVLMDEIALRFQARGMPGREALGYARDALAVMEARDRAVAGVAGSGSGAGAGGMAELSAAVMDRLWEALHRARESRNSKLALGALFFAMNRRPYGLASLRALAEEQGVSPEAVSNEVESMQEIMGTARTIAVKSEAANRIYRGTNGAKTR